MESRKVILISCAGLGMGNASRIAAVLEAIAEKRLSGEVTVFSWGAGYRFLRSFRERSGRGFRLIRLTDYPSPGRAPFSFPFRLAYIYLANTLRIRRFVTKRRPRVALLDSDYHFGAYFLSGTRVVFLGQAWDVVDRFRRSGRSWSWSERFWFLIRELGDAWVQRIFSGAVLAPAIVASPSSEERKIRRVPLIVRREYLTTRSSPDGGRIGILLSGSGLEAAGLRVLARERNFEILDETPSSASALDGFSAVIVQGGLSSLSECSARGRFCYVVPLRNHPEQLLNADVFEENGWGELCDVDDLRARSNAQLLERAQRRPEPGMKLFSGADAVTDFLASLSEGPAENLAESAQRG